MWEMKPINDLPRSEKYKKLGRPLRMTIPELELWKPGELVRPFNVPEDLRSEQFYLGDFGLAKRLADPETEKGYPPILYCSPERLHGREPSYACDMWSYMVIFCVLYLRFPPFRPCFRGGVISGMVKCLGPLPVEWKGFSKNPKSRDDWYDQCQPPDPGEHLSEQIAYYRPETGPVERQHMLDVMSKVFVYDPDKRLSAAELLQDPSFLALMEIYGC